MHDGRCVCSHTKSSHEGGDGKCTFSCGGVRCKCGHFLIAAGLVDVKIEAFNKPDMVNHPSHYGGDTPYEVIKVLFAWGLERYALRWNAVKYIARAHKKGAEVEDLKKARFYLDKEITNLEKGQ